MSSFRAIVLAAGLASLPATVAHAVEPPPKFSVVLTMSPSSLAKLRTLKEQVTVSAHYYGMPTPAAEQKKIPNEMGEVDLGYEEQTRPPASGRETFDFTGRTFQTKKTKWVEPGTAGVLINVYSARKVSDDNFLDCGVFQDRLELANAQPIEIACKLIGE